MRDGATTRLDARGAREGRDRAGLLVADLVDDAVEREWVVAEQERAAGDGRDQRDLVPVGERAVGCRVFLVHRVQQAGGLVAELERAPYIRDRRCVDLALGPSGALAEPRKETDAHGHAPTLQPSCQSWWP